MASVVLQFSMFVLSWNKLLEFEDELIDVCSVVINGFSGILLDICHPPATRLNRISGVVAYGS